MSSIKDVAKRAGVSLSTVSIIVNGKAEERKISKATQERVRQAMTDLNYYPNISAKKLKRGYADKLIIALFWTFDFRKGMMSRFFSGLQEKIQVMQANSSIFIYPYTNGELYREAENFDGSHFHAAIVANASKEDLQFLEELDTVIPIILYNRFSERFSSVNMNDTLIGQLAADHLYQKGYRNPFILGSHVNFPGASMRREAFFAQMSTYGITIPDENIRNVTNSIAGGAEFIYEHDMTGDRIQSIDSFLCDSDAIALGLIHALQQYAIPVPETIGIIAIGNGDPQYTKYSNPSLTVINIPMEQMAASCYDLIKIHINNPDIKPTQIYFKTELIARKSTDRQ